MPLPPPSQPTASNPFDFPADDDDDEGWQDMPIVREDDFLIGLDEEDKKKYHYQPSSATLSSSSISQAMISSTNARGNLIDIDDKGNEWRSKLDRDESQYTRLRANEEDDNDEVHLRTKYLFDEDKAMTPLSQMQATKNLLTEAQRIAYVGVCALTSKEMIASLKNVEGKGKGKGKELKKAAESMELWALKIMGRLYYHMELETQEQKMIESLAEHGVQAMDLAPALMATHTVVNPEYDPEEGRRRAEEALASENDAESISGETLVEHDLSSPPKSSTPTQSTTPISSPNPTQTQFTTTNPDGTQTTLSNPTQQSTQKILQDSSTSSIPGVSTTLSSADQHVTLDIRWTVLCDLFLILIADSVYDARSRVLLESVARKLGLGWLDLVRFESRVTEALEIQEDVEKLENELSVEGAKKSLRKRRIMMLGLATLGGGLVIGLSAGLLAPVIGAGLAGALTTVGVTGTGAFLGGTAGAAVITTGGVLTGSGIAVRGMAKRTQYVRTFDVLPLHNNKRVSCILTVPGFMNGANDDPRLPFSVLDPIVGDVFSVLWEPEMIRETGSALKILTGEVLSQIGLTVLQATAMTTLMSALQWPIILTKLGYLIDNPWSNALDRAKSAGRVLADVLIQRHLGVRPITLIGFSLGARVIFYALLELAKGNHFGIVQDVFLLGATLTVSTSAWLQTRSVVSGRYVNAFAKNDWVLNYLFRATSGGVGTVAGLRAVEGVEGLENVDVTDKIAGHMSYRTFMPLILDQLGFPVFSDYFDEPEEPDFTEERIVVREEEQNAKRGWFGRRKSTPPKSTYISRPPGPSSRPSISTRTSTSTLTEDDLPPRMDTSSPAGGKDAEGKGGKEEIPVHAGFDLNKMREMLGDAEGNDKEMEVPISTKVLASTAAATGGPGRTMSTPPETTANSKREKETRREEGLEERFAGVSLQEKSPYSVGYRSQSTSSLATTTSSSFEPSTPKPPTIPLSFPESEEPAWSPPTTSTTTPNNFSFSSNSYISSGIDNPFAPPSTHNPFASPPLSHSFPSPPSLSANPFSSSSFSSSSFSSPPAFGSGMSLGSGSVGMAFGSDAGLSFGGADGSITVLPHAPVSPPVNDPWAADVKKSGGGGGGGFNSNPWS